MRYGIATPVTYTLEIVTYAQAIPLRVGGSGAVVTKETERSMDNGKAKEDDTFPLGCLKQGPIRAHLVCDVLKDEDPHMTMWIPAPHTIEGYAPGIRTAGPSSGVNQYGRYSTP